MRLLALLTTLALFAMPLSAEAQVKESAFDRILRTGTIRCGYYVFPPVTKRDVNTGELSGFAVDFMDRIAERAGLKVEWTEEVTFGNWIPALQSNRYDMACTPMWPELAMARVALFSQPLFFSGIHAVVRADDTRFDGNDPLALLNQPNITVLAQEGNPNNALAQAILPNAKLYSLAPESDTGSYYMNIVGKKADVALTDRNAVLQMNESHGKVLKVLGEDKPVKVQSFELAVNRGDTELLDFLNLAISEMNNAGEIDRMLRKWEAEPGRSYLRVAAPFAPPVSP